MLKQALVLLLGAFFFLSGANHFWNTKVLASYAERRRLPCPALAVKASGLLLMAGGAAFPFASVRLYAVIALGTFLLAATFLIHHFWTARERDERLAEGLHFAKNALIFVELLYIQFG